MNIVASELIRFRSAGRRMDPQRIQLEAGTVYRLPRQLRCIRVIDGWAWITHMGQDIILRKGEEIFLGSGYDAAVVSAENNTRLVLEAAA